MISITAHLSLVLANLTLKYPFDFCAVVRRVFMGFSLSILLFLSGCSALGPDFLKPEAKVATDWLTDGSVFSKDKAFQEKWWETFNDPVLNSLIEQAYQQIYPYKLQG